MSIITMRTLFATILLACVLVSCSEEDTSNNILKRTSRGKHAAYTIPAHMVSLFDTAQLVVDLTDKAIEELGKIDLKEYDTLKIGTVDFVLFSFYSSTLPPKIAVLLDGDRKLMTFSKNQLWVSARR